MLYYSMYVLKKTYQHIIILLTGITILSAFTACNMVVDGESLTESAVATPPSNYINLTLYVSSGQANVTRAPQGGEDGDGREAGFERENLVGGITLILFKGTGLDDATAKVNFVRYFTVTEANLEGRDSQGTTYDYAADETYRSEARYTTGDQKLEDDDLDLQGTYHVLIVANQDVSSACAKGTLISEVLNKVLTNVYATATPANPNTAQQFVMTSERDATINFATMAPVQKAGVANGRVYRVMQPMLIERMSARIDFNTKGSTFDSSKGGYVYPVGSTSDLFVVTKVTPFNLYNGTEYLFKRVQDAWPATVTTYLGDETTSNYVVDPNTSSKTTANWSTLSSLYLSKPSDINTSGSSDYTQTMSAVQSTSSVFTDASSNENVIIAYPKENTLLPSAELFTYATGIAFEGEYYTGGTGTPEKRTYYYYIRHQGESSGTYPAKKFADLDPSETCGSTMPMNYGIVRNNIYRISIQSITPDVVEGPKVTLNIKVKMWDPFLHDIIYM